MELSEKAFSSQANFHLAGIIPIAGKPLEYKMPYPDCLLPVAPDYTMIEAAVTPEPPPDTSHVSLLFNGTLSDSSFSSKATSVHLLPSLSIPISTSPESSKISLSIVLAASNESSTNSGCKSNALHLKCVCSNEYDLVTPLAEH